MPQNKCNIATLAKFAQVSPATVSRVLNNHPYVTKQVREKIFNAATQLGYQLPMPANKKRLAIIINDQEEMALNAYGSNMLFHLTSQCQKQNIVAEIVGISNLELLEQHFFKTAIFFNDYITEKCVKKFPHIKFIGINNAVPGTVLVSSDDQQGLKLAFDYLKDTGHRRIAQVLPNDKPQGNSALRQKLFCQLSREMGVRHPEDLICYLSHGQSLDQFSALIRFQKPDALLLAGEDMLYQVNYALSLMNLKIPEDISVIGFENIFSSQYMIPPQTTIQQDFDQLAAQAVQLASRSLDGEALAHIPPIIIPCSFIRRASVQDRTEAGLASTPVRSPKSNSPANKQE